MVDARVKILSGGSSPRQRLNEVGKIFLSLVEDHAPEILIIEKPFPFWSEQSVFLDVVVNEIKCLAKKERIKIYEFGPKTVRKIVCGNGSATKKDLAKVVCSIYPELKIYLDQTTKIKEKYWDHIFDSAGLGVCYLKKRGELPDLLQDLS